MKKIYLLALAGLMAFPVTSNATQSDRDSCDNVRHSSVEEDRTYSSFTRNIVESKLIKPDMVKYTFSLHQSKSFGESDSKLSVKNASVKTIKEIVSDVNNVFGENIVYKSNSPVSFNFNAEKGKLNTYMNFEITTSYGDEIKLASYMATLSKNQDVSLTKNAHFFISDKLMSQTTDALSVKVMERVYSIAKLLNGVKNENWSLNSLNMSFGDGSSSIRPQQRENYIDQSYVKVSGLGAITQSPKREISQERAKSVYIKAFANVSFEGYHKS